jgi:hypothetical protein
MKEPAKSGFFKSLFGHGRRVPARAEVRLYVPVSPKSEMEAGLNIEAMWNQVLQKRVGPLLLLHEANRYLQKINPLPLTYEQRTRLSNILLNEVVTAVSSLFARFFQQGGGVPETREQRDGISQAVHAAEQLAYSYKLLFRQDWAELAQDRPMEERTAVVVMRILECVRLEQLLRAFRYQKLPQHAWQDINQLFFALRAKRDVKTPYPLKIQWTVTDASSSVELFPRTASLERLYLSIQLTGLLDVITWPVRLMYQAGRYLSDIDETLIKNDNQDDVIHTGYAIIYQDQGIPPRFSRSQSQFGEALLVDLNPVIRQVRRDRAALVSSTDLPPASAALREIPEWDRITFLDLLLNRLHPQQRGEVRHAVFDARQARVYGGFEAVYCLFRDINRKDNYQDDLVNERRFWDTLAEHTSIVAEGEDASLEPRWIIADEGPGGVRLHLKEGEYGVPLYVGRLVAYNCCGENLSASKLGYVVRLQRIGDDEVEVAIARLREQVSSVVVENPDASKQDTWPALLIRGADGKLQLLLDNRYHVPAEKRLAFCDGDRRHTGTLGGIEIAYSDFTVFDLHTAE